MGLPRDLPLMPGETQAERDAGGDVPPLRPRAGTGGTPAIPPPGTGGGTPTPLASTSIGEDLLNWLGPPANASVTPTPTTGWNNNPGTIPPDIANTSPMPKAPKPTATGGAATGGAATGGATSSASSLDATSGRVQARDIYDYLVNEKGVPPSKAVGVVASIEQESGFKVNTVHDGGTGYGLFGHRDPKGKSGRRSALFEHAGTQTPSAKQQLDYLVTESEWKKYSAVDNGGNHRADAASFTKIVERPANKELRAQERADLADNYASYMGSGPAAAQPATVPADTGGKAPAAPSVDTTGLNIEDQSDPNFGYGESATANKQPFKGIIFHHTSSDSLQNEVNYGKTKDAKRGGAFGYHYYIDRDGKVVQGAPLDKRTNHIKPGSKSGLSNKDAMGISLVGAKDGATPEQLAAAQKLGTSVMASNNIDPKNIYGHGELQKDRMAHEGVAAADQLRKAKPSVPKDTGGPEAKPPTVVASGKGGKLDTEVPSLASVAPTEQTQTPEEAAAQAAKDAEAKRMQASARDTSAGVKEFERKAKEAKAAKDRAEQGLPPAPDGTDARSQGFIPKPPGDMPVDPKANETIGATKAKDFGTLAVNVNHTRNGVLQRTDSQTLRAGSGGADNSVKGAVNISPEAVA